MNKKGEMFMQIITAAIGIGVILMVGYFVINQIKSEISNTTTNMTSTGIQLLFNGIIPGFGLIAVGMMAIFGFVIIKSFNMTDNEYYSSNENKKEEKKNKYRPRKVFY